MSARKMIWVALAACVGVSGWALYLRGKESPESMLVQHLGEGSESLRVEVRSCEIHGIYEGRDIIYLLRMQQPIAIEVWAYNHGFADAEEPYKGVALVAIQELTANDEVRRILTKAPNVRYLVNKKHSSAIWLVWANNGSDAVLFIRTM